MMNIFFVAVFVLFASVSCFTGYFSKVKLIRSEKVLVWNPEPSNSNSAGTPAKKFGGLFGLCHLKNREIVKASKTCSCLSQNEWVI